MKMINGILLGFSIIFLAGCTTGGEIQEITYKNISNLGPVEFTIQPSVIEQEEVVESVPDYVIDKIEIAGDCEFQERTMSRRTYVRNKPNETAAQLGRLEMGDTIQVIEATEDEAWFKISYNGRVAYVTAANVSEEVEAVNTPEVNQQVVSSVNDLPVTDNTVDNTTPVTPTNNTTSTNIPAIEPNKTPSETSVETSTVTPTETSSETPVETPTVTPTETSSETPVETPTITPTETPSETPVEIPTETPAETSVDNSGGEND